MIEFATVTICNLSFSLKLQIHLCNATDIYILSNLSHIQANIPHFISSVISIIFQAQCTTEVYKKSDGSCACGFYLDRGLTWREAADACHALGASLPEIFSADDNEAILKLRVTILL